MLSTFRKILSGILVGFVAFFLATASGNAQEIYKYQAQTRAISLLGFAPGSDTIITYGNDKVLNYHLIRDRLLLPQISCAEGKIIVEVASSFKWHYIAYKTWGNKIFITLDGKTVIDVIDSHDDIQHIAFSNFEENTMYYLEDQRIMKWSWPSKQVVNGCMEQITANAQQFALCNRSKGIVTLNSDQSVSFFNRPGSTGQSTTINPERKLVSTLAVSPDDEYLALGFITGAIDIYNLRTGVFLKRIHEHTMDISDLCFAPQGPFLVSRSSDWSVRIWYVPEGRQIFMSEGASTRPGAARAVVSADGKYLAINKDQLIVQYFDLRRILSEWLASEGEAAMAKSDYPKAEEFCSRSVEIFPGYDYYYKRGMIRLKLQKQDEAMSDFNEALKLRALGKEALLERCKLFMERGRNEEALTDCNTLTRLYKRDSLSWGMKGMILQKLGKYAESGIAFDSAIQYSRNPDTYRYTRALSQKRGRQYAAAINDLNILVAKNPGPDYLMNRALCHYFTGNFTQAYADLKQLEGINTNYPGFRKYLAFSAFLTGKYPEAQLQFSFIQGEKSENDIMTGSALSFLLSRGSNEEAQKAISKLLRLQPMNYDLHFLRGMAFVFLDDMQSAYEIMSKVYKPVPEYHFSLRDTLCLNPADGLQKGMGGLLSCLSDGISKLKLDYSDQTYAERQEDYRIRLGENQQKLKEAINSCSLDLSAEFRLAFFNVSTMVEVKIDSMKALDASRKKFCYFVKGKKYFLKENSTYEQLLKDNWKTAIVKAEQRYSASLKVMEYQNLVVSLKDIGVETPLYAEVQAKPETQSGIIAKAEKTPVEAARGVKDVSEKIPELPKPVGKNYLLMIGVNNYKFWTKLNTPLNDLKELKNVLCERYQFSKNNTIELIDAGFNEDSLDAAFNYLIDTLREEDRLLIYYAGHGYKDPVMDEGFWIPFDAKPGKRTDYIKNADIVSYIKPIKARHILLIMDACYSGTLLRAERGGPSQEKSLEKLDRERSRFALASGRENETVPDDFDGQGHSPFALSLIKFLKNTETDISIGELSALVMREVGNYSSQQPVSGPINNVGDRNGQFIFHLKK
jgi:tetratricopeptide (TPR) repeat protein